MERARQSKLALTLMVMQGIFSRTRQRRPIPEILGWTCVTNSSKTS
jgi:hypothetical protein